MKSHFITHKGKRIFVFDVSHLGSEAAAVEAEVRAVVEVVTKEPLNSLLSVTYCEGTVGTPAVLKQLEWLMTRSNNHIKKRAVVGVSGLRRFLVDTVNRISWGKPFSTFDSMDQAFDWLVQ